MSLPHSSFEYVYEAEPVFPDRHLHLKEWLQISAHLYVCIYMLAGLNRGDLWCDSWL